MKQYSCICGKRFTDPQSFNGHKQGCKVHLIDKYGDLDIYYSIKNKGQEQRSASVSATAKKKRESQLAVWISEKHVCERCGKVMSEKYGSGRFCSRTCANSHAHSQETRDRISRSVQSSEKYQLSMQARYPKQLRVCCICGEKYTHPYRITCSDKCLRERFKQNAIDNKLGGPSKVSSYGKRGTFRGIHCDSTYELAVVIYCLDHNIGILRNDKSFQYTYEGKTLNYYPDFYLPEYDMYLEVKGRDLGPVYEKLQCVLDAGKNIQLLHYEDLIDCFNYVCSTYNVRSSISANNLFTLYDDYIKDADVV